MKEILLATRNRGKLQEFQSLFDGLGFKLLTLDSFPDADEVVEDGITFKENAIKKALEYSKATGLISIADDSGLVVESLGGRPGVFSSRYAGADASDNDNNEKLLADMKDVPAGSRDAAFVCTIAVAAPDGKTITSEGRCEGEILAYPNGDGGFGYDPLFYIPSFDCTMAELPESKKNEISHRGKAVKNFKGLFLEFLS